MQRPSTSLSRRAPALTSFANYGRDEEGHEGSHEGHAQGMFDHIHGLVRICFWPLLDCSIDSVWLIVVFWFGSWWVPGASGRAPEVAETPTSRGPRSPRVPGHKYKNPYLLWGPLKRPSLGAGGGGFVFGPLVWQKTYHCPALQGGRPLSAELVDLATIASLQGHEEGARRRRPPMPRRRTLPRKR